MSFNDDIKKIILAGIGAVAVTAEKSKELVDTLVEKGQITVEQGKVLNQELKQNVEENIKKHVTVTISSNDDSISNIIDKLNKLSPDEIAILKSKLSEMEKKSNGEESNNN